MAITFLLAPAYIIKFNLFGFPSNVLMAWVFLFWIIFAIWLIAKKQISAFLTVVKNTDSKILILTGLFFTSGIISLWVGDLDRAKLGQFIVLFLQPIGIFFIGKFLNESFPNTKYIIHNTLYALLGLAGAYALIQYLTLLGLPPAWWGNNEEPKRALSFFIHPNFYALWCAPLLAFLLPDLGFKIKDLRKNHLAVIAWVLGSIGLFLSLSRAGWLGLAAAILTYLIVAADKKIRQTVFAAVIIMIIIIFAVPNFRYRVLLPFYGEKSAVSRFSLWDTGYKGIKQSPLTGLGLTGFSKQWNTLNTDPGLTETHNYPHNIFLDLWVETGLIGLISLTGLMGLYIFRGLKNKSNLIALSVSLFLITLLVQGQIDNPYFKNDLAMVFWIILTFI